MWHFSRTDLTIAHDISRNVLKGLLFMACQRFKTIFSWSTFYKTNYTMRLAWHQHTIVITYGRFNTRPAYQCHDISLKFSSRYAYGVLEVNLRCLKIRSSHPFIGWMHKIYWTFFINVLIFPQTNMSRAEEFNDRPDEETTAL